MRVASYVGFLVMVGVGINAFSRGTWWGTIVELGAALGIGWFSLSLFVRASVRAAGSELRGTVTPEDERTLRDLGSGAAYREAQRQALRRKGGL